MGVLQELREQFQKEDQGKTKAELQRRATEQSSLTPDEWMLLRTKADRHTNTSGPFGVNGSLKADTGGRSLTSTIDIGHPIR